MESIKVLSLFSGIGAFEKALTNLDINYEIVNYCEIDKYASHAYSVIHAVSEDLNLKDITKIDIGCLPYCDLITHGSPCQDFSVSGENKGGDEGSNTRSSLMWNTVSIVKHIRPRYVVWENVKNVLSKTHEHNFDKYINTLRKLGYNNYYKVLNAKDFNIPQNRERIFVVSVRNDVKISDTWIEDINTKELSMCLKDIIEPIEMVPEKYYLSESVTSKLIYRQNTTAKSGITIVGDLNNSELKMNKRIFSTLGICSTILTTNPPKIYIETPTDTGYKIRKLMPVECWRLMGFSDKDYWRVKETLEKTFYKGKDRTDSQMYKMAGNSIVVNVLESIFKSLLIDQD